MILKPKHAVSDQCYQMARLLFQYVVICNIEIVANSKRNLPKYVQNFAKQSNN